MSLLDSLPVGLIYKFTILILSSVVLLTLLSQFGNHLYLELTTHFRLQYIIAAFLTAGLLAVFQSWKFVPIALLCAGLNFVYVLPYYRAVPKAQGDSSGVRLRLFHANVLKVNKNYKRLLEVALKNDADVVVLQEFTPEWANESKVLEEKYPYMELCPRPSGSGMALFSQYPISSREVLQLDETTHIGIIAKLDVHGKAVTVLAIHPTVPLTKFKFVNRNRQFEASAKLLKQIEGPKLLVGDLNCTMWSPYFVRLAKDSGLRDARLGFGLQASWPQPLPAIMRLPIDHCLVSEEISVEKISIGETTGSDHRPLVVELRVSDML